MPIGVGLNRSKGELEDYLSLERTQCVKGMFVMLVFFSHLTMHGIWPIKLWFDLLVRVWYPSFLFYSGYAVTIFAKRMGRGMSSLCPENELWEHCFSLI